MDGANIFGWKQFIPYFFLNGEFQKNSFLTTFGAIILYQNSVKIYSKSIMK